MAKETMHKCRFCGGENLSRWTGDYFRCNDCLYISTVPEPSVDELNEHYKHYHEKNHQASQQKNEQRLVSYQQEVQWLTKQLGNPLPGKVFDYGASGGYFLDALASFGGVPTDLLNGDDASPGAINLLKEKNYYCPIHELEDKSTSLLVLRGVLEHLLDFRGVLNQLCAAVEDAGYFFITATPDSSGTVANLYRDQWVQHHYPSHFQHFNSALVDRLLAENSFVPLAVVDLYQKSVYRSDKDDQVWLNTINGKESGGRHAYWGSMMTRLYKKV